MKLSAQRLRELVCYDEQTGIFTRRVATGRWGRSPAGSVLGYVRPDGYIAFAVDRTNYLAHRLAWLYVHGEWPSQMIDHINGSRADNRISNLRDVPAAVNCENREAAQSYSRSGVLGVCVHSSGAITSQIKKGGKAIHLGTFQTIDAARAAYLEIKRELHAGYAG